MHAVRRLLPLPLWVAALVLPWLAVSASADPRDPVIVELPPEGQGDVFSPGVRSIEGLALEYVEEEYFVSGAATLFNYGPNPPLGPTDIVPIQEDVPYKTRIIVRRPVNRSKFNGTVVIEWWNSVTSPSGW